jgi:hypothetical protein
MICDFCGRDGATYGVYDSTPLSAKTLCHGCYQAHCRKLPPLPAPVPSSIAAAKTQEEKGMTTPQTDLTREGRTLEIAITDDEETALIAYEMILARLLRKHEQRARIAHRAAGACDVSLRREVRRLSLIMLAADAMGMVAFLDRKEADAQAETCTHCGEEL